jgi:hypothetical protein
MAFFQYEDMDSGIQFSVDFAHWKGAKQLPISGAENPLEVISVLRAATEKLDESMELFLKRVGNLNELDALIAEAITSYQQGNPKLAVSLMKGTGPAGKIMKPFSETNPKWQAKEQKEMIQFLKAYATRKFMRGIGINLNYGALH